MLYRQLQLCGRAWQEDLSAETCWHPGLEHLRRRQDVHSCHRLATHEVLHTLLARQDRRPGTPDCRQWHHRVDQQQGF